MFITRFAPSPTGPLHLGHAYSAMLAHDRAQAEGGTFLLRIDDLDHSRCRPEWEAQIFDDLAWLGLDWPRPVLRQSTRLSRYRAALNILWDQGLLYHCSCSRADIRAAASAPQEGAPLLGPDGVIYPGTCRPTVPQNGSMPEGCALRLDMARACARLSKPLIYREKDDLITPRDLPETVGDVVLARREMGASYHLSVVVDDADQGITHVIRGEDLQEATQIHVLLQRLLGLPTPAYHHHALIRDDAGKRLAKRDDARAIATYRAQGASPQDIRAMVGL
ncbi:Glutamyl-Q tRNA(Asp) synthetase [Roseovarius sp. EC-HK134]|uniref:tRNA glutamyl-Q(34) synthetase GluQRS n=1 Tax=unclassified Roseovarius TaxID=2614913 RepID=UPI001250F0EA|nr:MULTISPECIES: tRNA glutamyl-Q(34) synthetase GluQRS [unclassified Roseovarius]VVT28178.1 Glutamyl-Q tRNA(Asp) synthetase [Roseovarius sp. EC-SD190]VVT28690.1 Glutamyl-Q tRNA(Asp) synthetase [Roseovarius sp. EC-HK134]